MQTSPRITEGLFLETQEIHYCEQPRDRRIVCREVLCRKKLDGAIIPPDKFLSNITQEQALALDIEVFKQALDLEYESLSINVFPSSLIDTRFVNYLLSHSSAIKNKSITLEIIEKQPISNFREINLVARLLYTQCNIELALDDFGTHNSSTQARLLLPVSRIKIDRSFLLDEVYSQGRKRILKDLYRTTTRANSLDKQPLVVLEGVETEELLALGIEAGFNYFQGYLFG